MSKLDELIQQLCPDGVDFKPFEEVASYYRGVTYNKTKEVPLDSGGTKILRANNISLGSNRLNFEDLKEISTDVNIKDYQWLYSGDILICAGSGSKEHIGKVAYISENINYAYGGFMGKIVAKNTIIPRFLFYVISGQMFKQHLEDSLNSTTINNLNSDIVNKFIIPLPPLPVQEEIVRLLDQLTETTQKYQAELEAELDARKKQYEEYRDQLLDLEGKEGVGMKMSNFCILKAGKSIKAEDIKESQDEINIYPCFGGNGIRGYISYYSHDGEYPIIGRQGALCGCVNWAKGKFYATEHAVVAKGIGEVSQRFLFKLFDGANLNQYKTQGAQPGLSVTKLNELFFKIPPLTEQERIVNILDQMEKTHKELCQSIETEIKMRKQQYEYYRNRLLDFKKKED